MLTIAGGILLALALLIVVPAAVVGPAAFTRDAT